MAVRQFTAEDDDALLLAVRLRCRGDTVRSIAKRFGLHHATMRDQLEKVRSADISMSGEPRSDVVRAYWGR